MDGYGSDLKASSGFSAQNSGSCIVLAQSAIPKVFTGSTVETEFAKIVIPGGLMGPNGSIRITALWSLLNNANAKLVGMRFAGQLALSVGALANIGSVNTTVILRNRGEANQVAAWAGALVPGAIANAPTVLAVDTRIDQILTITGQLQTSAADTITLEGYTVEVLNPL